MIKLIIKILSYSFLGAFLGIILNFVVQLSLLVWLDFFGEESYWPLYLNVFFFPFSIVGLLFGIINGFMKVNRMIFAVIIPSFIGTIISAQMGFLMLQIWFNFVYQKKVLNFPVTRYRASDFWNAANVEGWPALIVLVFILIGMFCGICFGLNKKK